MEKYEVVVEDGVEIDGVHFACGEILEVPNTEEGQALIDNGSLVPWEDDLGDEPSLPGEDEPLEVDGTDEPEEVNGVGGTDEPEEVNGVGGTEI